MWRKVLSTKCQEGAWKELEQELVGKVRKVLVGI